MKCSIDGCPGEYESREILHTVRHQGEVRVIDQVPAEVCDICGDILLTPETVRRIERILQERPNADRSVRVFRARGSGAFERCRSAG